MSFHLSTTYYIKQSQLEICVAQSVILSINYILKANKANMKLVNYTKAE